MTAEVNRLSSFGNASRCVHSHPALGKWRMKEEGPRPKWISIRPVPFLISFEDDRIDPCKPLSPFLPCV